VFPGGRIDQADRDLAGQLELGDGALVAAVRETLEETAVPVGIAPVPERGVAVELQQALASDRDFGTLLRQSSLAIDASALTAFARWVPKFHAVRRFDTLFYVARAPAGDWVGHVIEGECAGAYWLSAAEALEREQRREARLIFPTRRTLERLAQHRSFDEIRADAVAHRVEPISPWVEERDGERFITIPSGLGYPVIEERLDGLWRG
jgi:8-oxo-dGTP pyrophosphatase MutT (NUDIX family)